MSYTRRRKITFVGAGDIGSRGAGAVAARDIADVVLYDEDGERAAVAADDLDAAGPIAGYEPRVTGTDRHDEAAGSDLVVLACGEGGGGDLLERNHEAVRRAAEWVSVVCPAATVLVVSPPVEPLCHVAYSTTQFPRNRVLGLDGLLDSARLAWLLAAEAGVSARDVRALVLGGSGTTMVPVSAATTVGGVQASARVPSERLAELVERVRARSLEGAETLAGASAAAIGAMTEAVLLDQRRLLPATALCQGEYGINDVFVGVPVRLGAGGIEEIVELDLSAAERDELAQAARQVRAQVDSLPLVRTRSGA